MNAPRLDGVLAIRQSWAHPDEPILLCVGAGGSATRFDVAGLDWAGKPQPGGVGRALWAAAGVAAGVATAVAEEDLGARERPHTVVFGPGPDATAARAGSALREVDLAWLVLTPRRLAWVRTPPEAVVPEPEKSLFGRVGDFAKGARDAFAGKSPYPPHHPIPTAEVVPVVELPRQQIAGVAIAERKLPQGAVPREAEVLRISLADGSGVDVLAAGGTGRAQRLLALVNGR